MGSIRDRRPAEDISKEYTVFVTGFGPFLDSFPVNSSWCICESLPEYLPATDSCPGIRIVKHPQPIPVAYHTVAALVPKLLSATDSHLDIVLHIGLAARFGRRRFVMERQSQRGVFGEAKDVEGQVFSDEEDAALWQSPKVLKPTFDTTDVWRRWRSSLVNEDVDVRPSDDPGNFLCGFIYYASLAWYWERMQDDENVKDNERPVMFMHVPDLPTKADIDVGTTVAIALIRSLVESRITNGVVDPPEESVPIPGLIPVGTVQN